MRGGRVGQDAVVADAHAAEVGLLEVGGRFVEAELEELVSAMEGGLMPLDRLLGSYQRGAELLDYCRSRLKALEDQVKVLEDGRLKDWNAA